MKKVKKVLSILTATALVATLAACGGTSDKESGAASGGDKLKKITLFQSKVEITEPLEALVKTYKEETG
ncbi:carbohydrate ABC transporter substrate-binding protein, partial [Paenibacillus glucanolyticus]